MSEQPWPHRKLAARAGFGYLFSLVSAALLAADLMLIGYTPDEYDPEAVRIMDRLPSCTSRGDTVELITGVFTEMFNAWSVDAHRAESLDQLADRLLHVWQAHRSRLETTGALPTSDALERVHDTTALLGLQLIDSATLNTRVRRHIHDGFRSKHLFDLGGAADDGEASRQFAAFLEEWSLAPPGNVRILRLWLLARWAGAAGEASAPLRGTVDGIRALFDDDAWVAADSGLDLSGSDG